MRRHVAALALADVLVLLGAAAGAVTLAGDDFGERVRSRPWPARVSPTGPWSATVEGTGSQLTMTTVVGFVPGALGRATFELPAPRSEDRPYNLTLPDGGVWYPRDTFRLDAAGDLAFTSMAARDGALEVGVGSLQSVLAQASGPITAIGGFTSADGRRVDRLDLPKTTRVGEDCGRPACLVSYAVPGVSVAVFPGTTVRAMTGVESGEVAIAGAATAVALGRTWNGLVAAVEGHDLTATATWDGQAWSVQAAAGKARQVWIDVWPVADTTLSAMSHFDPGDHSCFGDCSVRLRLTNTGWATSQIHEAEGAGRGASRVRYGLRESSGHDAGLGVERGGHRNNLAGGGDVSPVLEPRQTVDRGLGSKQGSEVTLVLRGNFPDVTVRLAIPPL